MGEVYRARDAKLHRDVAVVAKRPGALLRRSTASNSEGSSPPCRGGGTGGAGSPLLVRPAPATLLARSVFRSVRRTFAIAPDGLRCVAIKNGEAAAKQDDAIVVVSHWFDELKTRMPIKQWR